MLDRWSKRLESWRQAVGRRSRAVVIAVASILTVATWGPMVAVALGHPLPAWESFVYWASGPFCHQLPERSFHIAGHVFPLCTRCTGMWLGITLGVVLAMVWVPKRRWLLGWGVALLFTALSGLDWYRESVTGESWNMTRAVLGFPLFLGVTLAVSYDTLAVLLAGLRTVARWMHPTKPQQQGSGDQERN